VKRMRGEPTDERPGAHLELDVEAYIPRGYIESDRQRMDAYRRIATCRTPEDVEQLAGDLRDAFGPVPDSAETLLTLAEIRVRAATYGINTIMRKEPDIVFKFDGEIKRLERLFEGASGRASLPDANTLHWRLPEHYYHGNTLLPVLRNLFRRESTAIAVSTEQIAPETGKKRVGAKGQAVVGATLGKDAPAAASKRSGPIRATVNERPADAPGKKRKRMRYK
jgi:hypothetical protein